MVEKKGQRAKRGRAKENIKGAHRRKLEGGGAAGIVLQGLSDIIPGLGRMLEGLEKSGAFQERLEAINKELDHRLRASMSGTGFIPKVEGGFSIRSLVEEKPAFEIREKPKSTSRRAARPQPAMGKDVPVDIFEDDSHLKIIAELPGVEEKNTKVELRQGSLVIAATTPYGKYYKEVPLPCAVKGEPKIACKNGILEIELAKEE